MNRRDFLKYSVGASLLPLLPKLTMLDPDEAYLVYCHRDAAEDLGNLPEFLRIRAAEPRICRRKYQEYWNPQQRWKMAESERRFALTPDGARAQQMLRDLQRESEIGSVEEFRFVESLA